MVCPVKRLNQQSHKMRTNQFTVSVLRSSESVPHFFDRPFLPSLLYQCTASHMKPSMVRVKRSELLSQIRLEQALVQD